MNVCVLTLLERHLVPIVQWQVIMMFPGSLYLLLLSFHVTPVCVCLTRTRTSRDKVVLISVLS